MFRSTFHTENTYNTIKLSSYGVYTHKLELKIPAVRPHTAHIV